MTTTRLNHLRRLALIIAGSVTLLAAGCDDDGSPGSVSGDGGADGPSNTGPAADGPVTGQALTFWQDVAPVMNQRCVRCHQEGGIGPFPLDNYATARMRAPQIAAAVASDRMPPFLVKHDGTCGNFDDSEALTPTEKAIIVGWAQGSKAEGTPVARALPAKPALEGGQELRTPMFAPERQGGAVAEFDEYRCFSVEAGHATDKFITGYDVVPGNAAIVHHALLFVVDPAAPGAGGKTNGQLIQELDDATPGRAGWPCFGAAGEGIDVESVPVTWAPGQGVVSYPAGMGVRLRPTDKLVVQIHYNLAEASSVGMKDSTTVRVRLADAVDRRIVNLLPDPLLDSLATPMPDVLPPGMSSYPYTWTRTAAQIGLRGVPFADLVGVMPHMHERGRTQVLQVTEGAAAPQCLSSVPRWDFHWQKAYFYREPVRLKPDSQLQVTCTYDTAADATPVLPGWGTRNEMCLTVLFLALPPGV